MMKTFLESVVEEGAQDCLVALRDSPREWRHDGRYVWTNANNRRRRVQVDRRKGAEGERSQWKPPQMLPVLRSERDDNVGEG
jgi:hypothetical protein